ncbi:Ku protein [Microbispora bryophytorum]|uniref:non-homologous end joining protein Ku n=1 Tax=Microbispora bryophytorum TaxID=1460882 RepID=UPI003409C97F
MRSIWKGAISFGLVTIPVKLYSATEQKDVTFHQVHREDGGRIKYKRVCSVDGEEVPYSDIAKGYELATGEMVVLTDEDFADLPLTSSRRIDVLQFTPADQIDPIYFAKSYYLEPDGQGAKPYVLLRDALERSGQVAVVKVALRQRESLAALRVRDGVFVLETMLWPDEIREADFGFLEEDVDVRPQELKMAESLIDTMVADFDPTEYKDAYREALQEVIEAKVAGKEVVAPETPAEAGPAVDLMAALRASVEAAKRERQGPAAAKSPGRAAKGKAASGAAAGKAGPDGAGEEEKAPKKRKTRRSA